MTSVTRFGKIFSLCLYFVSALVKIYFGKF